MTVVRLIVLDVAQTSAFYCEALGFVETENWGGAFAIVSKDDVHLWLSGPQTSAAKPLADGRQPVPGGWNRLVLAVPDLLATVESLRARGVTFRSDIIQGPGGQQILCDDPSGNPLELFQSR
ncbi:MAG: VOC family protein [Roseiflexaceae bacterium]|jgi:catechol 2,3-dioxygenase-like lactoylglutathione lyase family enzyme|nr:VOC family protein [Chloroflexaceae bacterium]